MAKVAIDAKRGTFFRVQPEDLTLVTDKNHPLYDERVHWPIDEAMVRNMMVYGVKKTVEARKNGAFLEVVDGRQRVKNACEANKRLRQEGKEPLLVKVELERGSDEDLYGTLVVANGFRRNDSPVELARKAQRMLGFGASDEKVCVAFGLKNRAELMRVLSLLDLAKPVQSAVDSGRISPTAASALAKLDRAEQKEKLEELLADGGKATVERAKAAAKGDKAEKKVRPSLARIREIRDGLMTLKWGEHDDMTVIRVLDWILGDVDERNLAENTSAGRFFEEVQGE